MAEISKENIIFNVSIENEKALDELSKKIDDLNKSAGTGSKQAFGRMKDSVNGVKTDAIDKIINDLDKVIDGAKEASEEVRNVGEAGKKASSFSFSGAMQSMRSFVAESKAGQIALNGVRLATGLASAAFKVLRVAMISTGVGAITAAFGALVAYLKDIDSVGDLVTNTFAGISKAIKELGSRIFDFGVGLKDIFTGNFSAGIDKMKNSFNGLASSMADAYREGYRLSEALDAIEDREGIGEAQIKDNFARIDALQKVYRFSSKQKQVEIDKEIDGLLKQNISIEQRSFRERMENFLQNITRFKKISSEQIATLRKANAKSVEEAYNLLNQGVITQSELDTLKELQDKRLAFEAKNGDLLEKVNARRQLKLDKIAEEAARKREKAAEEERKRQEAELKATEAFNALKDQLLTESLEDSLDKKVQELEVQKRAVQKQFEELAKAAKLPPEQVAEYNRQLEQLFQLKYLDELKKYNEALEKGEKEKRDKLQKALDFQASFLDKEIAASIDSITDPIVKMRVQLDKEAEELKESFRKLAEEAGFTPEQIREFEIRANQFYKALGDAKEKEEKDKKAKEQKKSQTDIEKQTFNEAVELSKKLVEAKVQQADAEIAVQEAKIGRLHELAEFGTAEQLQLEEDRLARLQQAREKDVRQQQQIAAVQQAVNQAVAASETIKAITTAFGSDPTGVTAILKAAAIGVTIAATLGGIYSSFASIPAFATGTEYLEGEGTGTSDSILARLSKGERVVPAKENMLLAGISNKDLPKFALIGQAVSDIAGAGSASDYSRKFDELIDENRMMRKKIDKLEIKMGVSNEGIYGIVTTFQDRKERLNNLLK